MRQSKLVVSAPPLLLASLRFYKMEVFREGSMAIEVLSLGPEKEARATPAWPLRRGAWGTSALAVLGGRRAQEPDSLG